MHFLETYVAAAARCAIYAGPEGTLKPVRRQCRGDAAAPDDNDSDAARHRFPGLATPMPGGLSAVATFSVGAADILIGSCR
jgi:hypothetical protein